MCFPRFGNPWVLLVLLTILSQVFPACNAEKDPENGRAIARVNGEYLYFHEVEDMIPPGTSKPDSLELVKNYINSWVRQKLIVHLAQNNLSKKDQDFTHEIETYKNSLIVYRYQEQLIKQKLDTLISDAEIERYYAENPDDFQLKDNIVKVLYVKLPANSGYISQVKTLIRSTKEKDKAALARLCASQAVNSSLDQENWLLFNDLLKEIPIKTYDQEAFLQNNRFLEIKSEEFLYLVYFTDFKIKESVSPLSFERENIRNMIINKRKLKLISEMEKEVYEKALKNKDFEIL